MSSSAALPRSGLARARLTALLVEKIDESVEPGEAGPASLRGEIQGLPPPDALPSVPGAADRMAQAVGIFLQVLERRGLRADLTPAERIALVAANRGNPSVLHLHFDSAAGLA